LGRLKNFGRVAEMFQQQPRAHRADMLNQIQRDERFPRVHAELKSFKFQVSSSKFQVTGHFCGKQILAP
jgi:hypothetical protein